MAKLSDVLNSILNDVMRARVNADMLTREVSRQYLDDPVLKLLPVPRVDFKGINVALGFALDEVKPEKTGWEDAVIAMAKRELENLIRRVLNLKVRIKAPRKGFAAFGSTPERGVSISSITGSDPALANTIRLEVSNLLSRTVPKLSPNQASFIDELTKEVYRIVSIRIRSLSKYTFSQRHWSEISAIVREYVTKVASVGQGIIQKSVKVPSQTIEISVDKESLGELPESALSKISLSIDVENYEWVTGEAPGGDEEDKLVPR